MNRLAVLLKRPAVRYLLIGGGVYVLEILVILVAQQSGASDILAVGIAFWIGLIVSFLLTKLITFSDKRKQAKILLPQIAAFSLLVLFNFGFTLLVTKILAGSLPPAVSRTIALGLTTIWNFYLYKTRIFTSITQPSKIS